MKTLVLPPTDQSIQISAEELRKGGVVGIPTETVYGLAGNVFDEGALTKIFSVKERPTFDPLIVHVDQKTLEDLERLGVTDLKSMTPLMKSQADKLMAKFWPGPLTLVLPKNKKIPDLVTSGMNTVAVRMPKHPVALKLISVCDFPIAAPSANRFGRISPTCAQDVFEELGERISFILDGGACEVGLESSVIAIDQSGIPKLLRPGAVSIEEIQSVLGVKILFENKTGASPGQLENHYAPKKPLYLLKKSFLETEVGELAFISNTARVGVLAFFDEAPNEIQNKLRELTSGEITVKALFKDRNLENVARELFSSLRQLDTSSAEVIIAEPFPVQEGLGFAIQDRLNRASQKQVKS